MDGDSQKDHVTIGLHGALCRLVTPDEWRTMSEEGRLRFINTRHGHMIGALQDHSLIAVPDPFLHGDNIDVPDADTEEAFLKNAEQAWLEKHGKER